MTVMTGKEALMELLVNEGVEYVFGMPGVTEVLFMDGLEDHPEIKYILGLHEVVAFGMAEGYSRTSGKVGVVNLHTCAGLAAAMPMFLNAHLGGIPLLVKNFRGYPVCCTIGDNEIFNIKESRRIGRVGERKSKKFIRTR